MLLLNIFGANFGYENLRQNIHSKIIPNEFAMSDFTHFRMILESGSLIRQLCAPLLSGNVNKSIRPQMSTINRPTNMCSKIFTFQ